MGSVMNVVKWILKQYKWFSLFILLCIVFTLLLFSFSDLPSFVTEMVAKNTRPPIHFTAEKLSLSLIPGLSLKGEELHVEGQRIPLRPLKAKSLRVTPSIMTLFRTIYKGSMASIGLSKPPMGLSASFEAFKPSVSAFIGGFYGADIEIQLDKSSLLKTKGAPQLKVTFEKLQLAPLVKAISENKPLPFQVTSGVANLDIDLHMDLSSQETPQGNVKLIVKKLRIPAFTFEGKMNGLTMPFDIPALSFTDVVIDGVLKDRRLNLKKATLGSKTDALALNLTRYVGVTFNPQTLMPSADIYEVGVELTIKRDLKQQLGAIMALISQYKGNATGSKETYKFKAVGRAPSGRDPGNFALKPFN